MLYDPNWKKPVEVELEDWQKILLRAADILDEKGWCQRRLHDGRGYCAIGAVLQATAEIHGRSFFDLSRGNLSDPDYAKAHAHLSSIIPKRYSIPSWNDTLGRKKEQVQAMLRKAAGVK